MTMTEPQKGTRDTADPQVPGLKVGARTEFCVIGDVIPGHLDALRQVLKEHMANPRTQEAVHEIGTLHEARFVLLDGGERLMFCSSFDGDWDPYIDDFAATAIGQNFDQTWNHVQGYPGVRSPKVKDWFKAHAVKAGNFVVAYPQPTVKQVWQALAVQEAFQQVLDTPGAAEALQHPALKPLLELAAA
jgi:hypothetical protein